MSTQDQPEESASPTRRTTPKLTATQRRQGRQGKVRRGAALVGALAVAGTLYSFAAPVQSSQAGDGTLTAQESEDVAAGKQMYENSCITCHGANLEGVTNRGVSLIGVGQASVYFQVGTGRMPLARQEAQPKRKPPKYSEKETLQLAAYIEQFGGGPTVPNVSGASLKEANLARGGELFRLNCASCHSFSGGGGALSSGKAAPNLKQSTPRQIYAAMLIGPQNMPVFGQNQLTPDQKVEIIAYVRNLMQTTDPGGAQIGRTGPVPEGLVIWLVGITAMLMATVWVAGKS